MRGANWICRNTPLNTGTRPAAANATMRSYSCRTDQECHTRFSGETWWRAGATVYCMRTDAASGNASGECSLGQAGDRCRCRGYGCGAPSNEVRALGMNCNEGLDCQLFASPQPDGMAQDWFCAARAPGARPQGPQPFCRNDEDCPTGEACIRFDDSRVVGREVGRCSKGLQGQLCNASGSGHDVRADSGKHTNNEQALVPGGAKWVQCAAGLRCVYRVTHDVSGGFLSDLLGLPQNDLWTCQQLQPQEISVLQNLRTSLSFTVIPNAADSHEPNLRSPAPNVIALCQGTMDGSPKCYNQMMGRSGGMAGGGTPTVLYNIGMCVKHSASMGECSRGFAGHRCRCSGDGCTTGIEVVDCQGGTQCTLFYGAQPGTPHDQTPLSYKKDEWFCTTPISGSSVGNPSRTRSP